MGSPLARQEKNAPAGQTVLLQLMSNCDFWLDLWRTTKDTGSLRCVVLAIGRLRGCYETLDTLYPDGIPGWSEEHKYLKEHYMRVHDHVMNESADYCLTKRGS